MKDLIRGIILIVSGIAVLNISLYNFRAYYGYEKTDIFLIILSALMIIIGIVLVFQY